MLWILAAVFLGSGGIMGLILVKNPFAEVASEVLLSGKEDILNKTTILKRVVIMVTS